MAETPPSSAPWASAYSGEVMPAHCFLKTVTRARMKPPMPPMAIMGATDDGSPVAKKRFHVHAAEATHKITRMPVLFTAPDTVMVSPPKPARSRKVFRPSVGFAVFIRSAIQVLLRFDHSMNRDNRAMQRAFVVYDTRFFRPPRSGV